MSKNSRKGREKGLKKSNNKIKSPIWLKDRPLSLSCATPYETEKKKKKKKHCYQLLETSPSSLIPYTSTNCKSHFYPPLRDIKDIVGEKIYSKPR